MAELIFQKDNIGLGKRKEAVARVFLVPGEGNLTINKVSGNKYLQYNNTYLNKVWAPLKELNLGLSQRRMPLRNRIYHQISRAFTIN